MRDLPASFATLFRAPSANDAVDLTRDDAATLTEGPDSAPSDVDPRSSARSASPRYVIKSVLGRGGMGEVRLCRDTRIGRDVAVKIGHAQLNTGSSRARFLREARVQGQLEHPAIVPVHDLELFDDGSAYFAMKRVRGKTLSTILQERRSDERKHPLRKLLTAFNSVCLAVEFAHSKGVLHRDIKPGNIMLGDFGEVYLLDWGLAKLVGHDDDSVVHDPTSDSALVQTQAGSLLGTPGYMAPEQIDPALGALGPAADVYALGAVLFEIVAGEPFVRAASAAEATMFTLQERDRRPSQRRGNRAEDAEAAAAAAAAEGAASALDAICRSCRGCGERARRHLQQGAGTGQRGPLHRRARAARRRRILLGRRAGSGASTRAVARASARRR